MDGLFATKSFVKLCKTGIETRRLSCWNAIIITSTKAAQVSGVARISGLEAAASPRIDKT
jgi:hypothetical protein